MVVRLTVYPKRTPVLTLTMFPVDFLVMVVDGVGKRGEEGEGGEHSLENQLGIVEATAAEVVAEAEVAAAAAVVAVAAAVAPEQIVVARD